MRFSRFGFDLLWLLLLLWGAAVEEVVLLELVEGLGAWRGWKEVVDEDWGLRASRQAVVRGEGSSSEKM